MSKAKVLCVSYIIEAHSAWIIPEEYADDDQLYVKWDKLHYAREELNAQKILCAQEKVMAFDFKRSDAEYRIFDFNEEAFKEEELYFDCKEEPYSEEELQAAKKQIEDIKLSEKNN